MAGYTAPDEEKEVINIYRGDGKLIRTVTVGRGHMPVEHFNQIRDALHEDGSAAFLSSDTVHPTQSQTMAALAAYQREQIMGYRPNPRVISTPKKPHVPWWIRILGVKSPTEDLIGRDEEPETDDK